MFNFIQKYILGILPICALVMLYSCSKDANSPVTSGTGGSYARFTVVDDHMYVATQTGVKIFDLASPSTPVLTNTIELGMGIETIFAYNNHLFIGSNDAMYILDITQPNQPESSIEFSHASGCDPVVANDSLAFITLRGGEENTGNCNINITNPGLYIVNIENISNPYELSYVHLPSPYGLGYDDKYLFVCVGNDGLRIYDYSQPSNLQEVRHLEGFATYDVIPQSGLLLVVGPHELRQYNYTNIENIELLSTMQF